MEKTSRLADIISGLVLLAGVTVAVALGNVLSNGSGPADTFGMSSTPAAGQMATSSTIQVGPQQVKTIFEANDSCMARIIGTRAQDVILTFDIANAADLTPSATVGFATGASTTRAYTSDEYGCGPVKAYAAASTTITKAELIR